MEFSKKITVLSWAVALILTALAVLLPLRQQSVDGIISVLPYSWGEVTACSGFYLWKAKNENRSKYAMRYVDKFADRYGIDAAARIAEVVLKD